MKDIWWTQEMPPRRLSVHGRSAIDPDCLVSYTEGNGRPVWIVDGGGKTDDCVVTHLNVRASKEREWNYTFWLGRESP